MEKLDAFGKALPEFRVKTSFGGVISLISILSICYLTIAEFLFFLQADQKDEVLVDAAQDKQMFDMEAELIFRDLPCAVLGINFVDSHHEESVLTVGHNILKQRVVPVNAEHTFTKPDGTVGRYADGVIMTDINGGKWARVGRRMRAGLHKLAKNTGEFQENLKRSIADQDGSSYTADGQTFSKCMSCYGAGKGCCNTCEALEVAFKAEGWDMPFEDHIIEQCARRDYFDKTVGDTWIASPDGPLKDEGCSINTHFRMAKTGVMVKMAVEQDFDKKLLHPDFIKRAEDGYVSFTHVIQKLRFGDEFPGFQPMLDGFHQEHEHVPLIESCKKLENGQDECTKLDSQSEHWSYEVKLVPTEFVPSGSKKRVLSHQYSATHSVKGVNTQYRAKTLKPPGLYMRIEFTPFRVRWVIESKPWSQFVINLMAILGGIYAFFGLVDQWAHQWMGAGGSLILCGKKTPSWVRELLFTPKFPF